MVQMCRVNLLDRKYVTLCTKPNVTFISGILPKPITLHFINTTGKKFHFSVFQLNTLDLKGDIKNIFWHDTAITNMFEECRYINAKPVLEGYNHNVFNNILAMYLQK